MKNIVRIIDQVLDRPRELKHCGTLRLEFEVWKGMTLLGELRKWAALYIMDWAVLPLLGQKSGWKVIKEDTQTNTHLGADLGVSDSQDS